MILYAFVVSLHHLKTRGKSMGPYVWQIHGAKAQKGSCFCEWQFCVWVEAAARDAWMDGRPRVCLSVSKQWNASIKPAGQGGPSDVLL